MLSSSEKKLLPKNKKCRRISEHRLSFPVCNSLHEQALLDNHAKYLSYGGYREVFKLDHDYAGASEALIVKELRFDLDTTLDMVEFVRMDAIVAERLTSSPLTFDIYGFCGLTVVSEFFQYGDIEKDVLYNGEGELADGESLNDAEDVDPKNDFTPLQKLELSLQMAESLAVLHNYPGGVIVHDDVQLAQFLYTSNDKTQIKLNDFNRAEFMLWDDEKQQYCDYQNGKGHGTVS
jgi:serine/threonine protein kinase